MIVISYFVVTFYLVVSEENSIILDANGEDTMNRDNETEQRGKINMIHFYMSFKVDSNYIRLFYILSFQVMRVLLHLN